MVPSFRPLGTSPSCPDNSDNVFAMSYFSILSNKKEQFITQIAWRTEGKKISVKDWPPLKKTNTNHESKNLNKTLIKK